MIIYILLIIIVISLLFFGLNLYKANDSFSVKKTKYEKKFMYESLKNIKDIYERFDLQNRNWITECVTIYSNGKSYEMTHPLSDKVEFKLKNNQLYVTEIIKSVSHYNDEEIVTYFDNTSHCLNDIYEKGVIVGFEIADRNFVGKPAEIRIDYKDKHYNSFLVWNIIEKI